MNPNIESDEAIKFLETFRKQNLRELSNVAYGILYRAENALADKLRKALTGE